jgi:carbon starvation protein
MFTNSLVITLLAAGVLYVAYRTYGRFFAIKVLALDPSRKTPAYLKEDGVDYVPTHRAVLFGHHFASIAGLGPILGPAIAVFWGWVPAILWVVFGSIFIGGIHDLSALYASLRHEGRGIGDFTREIAGPRARGLFLIIIFFLLALAMGVFALTMSKLFTNLSPQAVIPTFSLIGIAMIIGLLVYKLKWQLGPVTLIGLVLMFSATFFGLKFPVPLYKSFVTDATTRQILAEDEALPVVFGVRAVIAEDTAAALRDRQASGEISAAQSEQYGIAAAQVDAATAKALETWTYLLLAYAFVASVLPVWLLLQPRDYINSYQLYIGLFVLLAGLVVWHPTINAPAYGPVETAVGQNYAPIFPFLFITIACGAISGFHSLVSSGTTVRQIKSETDARLIGYGAMLVEGLLAVLVIMACVAGLAPDEYQTQYGSWTGLAGRGLGAFLAGAGTVASKPFLVFFSESSAAQVTAFFKNLIAVIVVSFAMTTLDSATRLLRFNVEEIGKSIHVPILRNRYVASLIAVFAIGFFALIKINGQPAGLTLWQLFGTTNQLLAAIGLMVVSLYLYQRQKPIIYTILPFGLMLFMVFVAMRYQLTEFYTAWQAGDPGSGYLFFVGSGLAFLTVWLIIEAIIAFRRAYFARLEGTMGTSVESRGVS